MKNFLIFLMFILATRNDFKSNRLTKENDLCETLYQMSLDDQKYRGTTEQISDKYSDVLDSLILEKGLDKESFLSMPEHEQGNVKRQALKLAARSLKPLMEQNDSLRVLQQKLDENNTEKLIAITKKHGWLTSKKIGCKENFKTVLIFRHAPKKYWAEIRSLIEKERIAKRISDYEYYLIDNHLKGRPPLRKKPSDFREN